MTVPAVPAVSVVIPAYDRAATIRAAVESVLRQTWRDLEVLVVDDGSRDGTPEVVRGIDDPRVRLIGTPRNMGASAARNLGTEQARAPWVAFQDSDDEWLPLKLEKQMARLLAPRPAGAPDWVAGYCGMLILGHARTAAGARLEARYFPPSGIGLVEGDILPALLRRSLISTQTLVARRDALLAIGGFDPEMKARIDWDCALRLAPLGPIAFVDEPLALQRFSPNSITADAPRKLAARLRLVDKHAALYAGHPAELAAQHYGIAAEQRHLGDLAGARRSLARARALAPGEPRYWAMSALVAAQSLAPGLARRGRARPPS